MHILHYTLGYPPSRTGGLVMYVIDLMKEQEKSGHKVTSLSPGSFNPLMRTSIKEAKNTSPFKIEKYEIINSQPLPIFGGIKNPKDFMKKVDSNIYVSFLKKSKPDVIHVHSLMGIHKEFFEAAKSLSIKIVFTSHDYFGLAPEPNFYYNQINYDNDNTALNWYKASINSMGTRKLRLFQTSIYPYIRNLKKYILKRQVTKLESFNFIYPSETLLDDYKQLKQYYFDIFNIIDYFHFNSTLARDVYQSNFKDNLNGKVISITNSNIQNRKISKHKKNTKLTIAYIGPDKDFKGFSQFVKLSKLFNNNFNFVAFGYEPTRDFENITQYGKFQQSDIDKVFEKFDILIVPSLWKETFGLVVLEALSYDKTVYVSDNVGAKDLLREEYIYQNIDELVMKITRFNKQDTEKNRTIKTMQVHSKEIIEIYNEVVLLNEFRENHS